MIFGAYPVFRKDLRLLGKQMIGALAVQILLMIGAIILITTKNKYVTDLLPMGVDPLQILAKIQIAVSAVVAVVAAAYWWAEERSERNDWFLRQFPITRSRLFGEKTAAGLTVLLILVAFQWLFHLIFLSSGYEIWDRSESIGLYICIVTLAGYLIGLPLSRFLKQSITVVLLGLGIEFLAMWLLFQAKQGHLELSWQAFSVTLIIVVPV
ncbi:MAG: hypothetical protein ABIH23_12515, partial [bacterium]